MTALANADVAVRGTPLDAGSGQVLLEVETSGAADQEAVETNTEGGGALGNEFTPARTPRFLTQIGVDTFHATATSAPSTQNSTQPTPVVPPKIITSS